MTIFTGLLAIPARLPLLGVGVVTLWRTRRIEGNRTWRYARRALFGAAGVLVVYALVLTIGLAYVTSHVGRAVVPSKQLGVDYEKSSSRQATAPSSRARRRHDPADRASRRSVMCRA